MFRGAERREGGRLRGIADKGADSRRSVGATIRTGRRAESGQCADDRTTGAAIRSGDEYSQTQRVAAVLAAALAGVRATGAP